MSFVQVKDLRKEFVIRKRRKSVAGSLKDLFHSSSTTLTAIDDISFSIERGECVGYVGPNGAGKTTTLRILAGILFPTAGSVTVDGIVPYEAREQYVRRVGVMFGSRNQLWPELSPLQSFELLKCIYGIKDSLYKENLAYLTGMLELDTLLERPLRELSLGQKMRCELASTFLHSPEIVFLDEPTIGLDFEAKAHMRDLICALNRRFSTTILFTSHDLQDIEKVCDRLMVIHQGSLLFDGQMDTLRTKYPTPRALKLKVLDEALIPELARMLKCYSRDAHIEGKKLEILLKSNEMDLPSLLSSLGAYGKAVDVVIEDASIENTVAALYHTGKVQP